MVLPRVHRPATAGLVSLALLVAGAASVAAHDVDQAGQGSYVAPEVVEPSPPTGAYLRGAKATPHEVWLVDQSNTAVDAGAGYGGRIHIYDGVELRDDASSAASEVVELGGATAALCRTATGANPVRPHMLYFTSDQTHAVLSFVASGHVVVLDALDRQPLACFRTEVGAGSARQAHAAVPTPDDRFILVANQNGKKFERIRTDYATGTFVQEPAATLDLTAGTTPSGAPRQTPSDPSVRPDNAPICPFVPSTGYPAFVSLRGGGLFAVDHGATPMRIVAEYTATQVARDGCGFTEVDGWVYGNGGSNPGNLAGWFVYRLPAGGPETYAATNPPGTPTVEVVDRDASGPRDAHGVVAVRDRYVWAFDRAAHVVQVYRADSAATVATVNLRTEGSQAPAPDIVAASPDGWAVYAATRGPNPLTGTHAAVGDAPGVMVLEIQRDGRLAAVRGHAAVTNVVAGVERADPHGIAVRRTG